MFYSCFCGDVRAGVCLPAARHRGLQGVWFCCMLREELVELSNTSYSCWAALRVACALRLSTLLIHELLH